MVQQHATRLLEAERCDDVLTLRFERPPGYEFGPGQYFLLTLATDEGEESKPFSHASAPEDEFLEMTTRVSGSAFKQALDASVPGESMLWIKGPAGRFGLDPDDRRYPVFLAGGVGITPVMSIVRHARAAGEDLGATLIYGNAVDQCMPYADEIHSCGDGLVSCAFVVERPSAEWTGRKGFITAATVEGCVVDPHSRPFYVTGPPVMVSAMESVLDEVGVAKENRHIERFGVSP